MRERPGPQIQMHGPIGRVDAFVAAREEERTAIERARAVISYRQQYGEDTARANKTIKKLVSLIRQSMSLTEGGPVPVRYFDPTSAAGRHSSSSRGTSEYET